MMTVLLILLLDFRSSSCDHSKFLGSVSKDPEEHKTMCGDHKDWFYHDRLDSCFGPSPVKQPFFNGVYWCEDMALPGLSGVSQVFVYNETEANYLCHPSRDIVHEKELYVADHRIDWKTSVETCHILNLETCAISQGSCKDNRGVLCRIRRPNMCKHNKGGCSHHCVNEGTRKYRCTCDQGYKLLSDQQCGDLNECLENNGGCEQNCTNFNGTFICDCFRGYKRNGKSNCQDEDECVKEGQCLQDCLNTVGSYKCVCAKGYKDTDGSCRSEASQESSPVSRNGSTKNMFVVGGILLVLVVAVASLTSYARKIKRQSQSGDESMPPESPSSNASIGQEVLRPVSTRRATLHHVDHVVAPIYPVKQQNRQSTAQFMQPNKDQPNYEHRVDSFESTEDDSEESTPTPPKKQPPPPPRYSVRRSVIYH